MNRSQHALADPNSAAGDRGDLLQRRLAGLTGSLALREVGAAEEKTATLKVASQVDETDDVKQLRAELKQVKATAAKSFCRSYFTGLSTVSVRQSRS